MHKERLLICVMRKGQVKQDFLLHATFGHRACKSNEQKSCFDSTVSFVFLTGIVHYD